MPPAAPKPPGRPPLPEDPAHPAKGDLTPDEAREVTAMARRLAALRLLEPAFDAGYQAVKVAAFGWAAPPA